MKMRRLSLKVEPGGQLYAFDLKSQPTHCTGTLGALSILLIRKE